MLEKNNVLKKLELSDRQDLVKFTRQFPPYNDFEFLSLWAYNIDGKNSILTLNNNLVIRIQDFITGDFFYSFLGTNKVKETIEALIEKSKEENIGTKLRLVPETSIQSYPELDNHFLISEDPDSFDYILSVDDVANLQGSRYHNKRNLVNNFSRLYPHNSTKLIDLNDVQIRNDIRNLFFLWEEQKVQNCPETSIEFNALQRLFDFAHLHKVICIGLYIDYKLIGFIAYHLVHNNYAIVSFEKADISYKGIYEYLLNLVARHLKTLGAQYINYEQDLGLPGLKKAKMLWRPVHFLKKYTIEENK